MMRIIRWLLIAVRLISPWVIRLVIFMGRLILTTVASLWVGVPTGVDRIAREWTAQAVAVGIPTEYDTTLYWIFQIVAYAMVFLGWIGFSYLTVLILRLVF